MPKLISAATAIPQHRVTQSEAKAIASGIFGSRLKDFDRLLPLFENTDIETRYLCVPPDWFGKPHSLEEKNEIYIRSATELGAEAARRLMKDTNTDPDQIDYVIYINTTGLATPSIDARLINILGLRRDIRRTPIWGLGCAGGAAGLSHAYHHAVGHPKDRVLVVAVELCGLTFIHDDFSKSNFVASALFADGAAAALVCGDDVESDGLDIVDTQSTFYPDSLEVMGWNIVSRGMQVVFDKRIPKIVLDNAASELDGLLEDNDIERDSVTQFLYHPGGAKVVDAYEKAYGTNGKGFHHSRAVLRDYGNMSSVTVLYVVERYLKERESADSGYGVISALGPGFCSESLLVKL